MNSTALAVAEAELRACHRTDYCPLAVATIVARRHLKLGANRSRAHIIEDIVESTILLRLLLRLCRFLHLGRHLLLCKLVWLLLLHLHSLHHVLHLLHLHVHLLLHHLHLGVAGLLRHHLHLLLHLLHLHLVHLHLLILLGHSCLGHSVAHTHASIHSRLLLWDLRHLGNEAG